MHPDLLETVILPCHRIGYEAEADFLTSAFRRHGIRPVVDAAIAGLQTRWIALDPSSACAVAPPPVPSPDVVSAIFHFVLSAGVWPPLSEDLSNEFHQVLDDSSFFPTIAQGLTCSSSSIRSSCIYILAKLQHPGTGVLLLNVLPYYESRDPLNWHRLLSEISWLHAGEPRPLFDRSFSHPHFLWRWLSMSELKVSSIRRSELTPQTEEWIVWQQNWLEKLLHDPAPEIRIDARREWELAKHHWQRDFLEKKESIRQYRAILRQFPGERYMGVANGFLSWKHQSDPAAIDYTVAEFEHYVRHVWPTETGRKT